MAEKQSDIFYAGMDDGFNTTIAYTERGEVVIRPSRIRIGGSTGIHLKNNQSKAMLPKVYKTDGVTYSVNASTSDDTVHDDYPFSGENRVMVQHVLNEIKHRDTAIPISMCTGLPIRRYYRASGQLNSESIEKKIDSLNQPVTTFDGETEKDGIKVGKNIVMPESLAAIFDLAIEEKREINNPHQRSPKTKLNKDVFNKHIAFVDIGGRTTDVAIWAAGSVERGDFATENFGMEIIRKALKEFILDEFQTGSVPDEMITQALKTHSISIAGKEYSVQSQVFENRQFVVEKIKNMISGVLGSKAKLIDEVVFFGGGAEQLYESGLSELYGHQRLLDSPITVNARAFYKYLRYFSK